MDDAFSNGKAVGQVWVSIFLFAGILKCRAIALRPTANKKCVFSLMFLLIGWMVASLLAFLRFVAPSYSLWLQSLAPGLCLALFITAVVFAILGLKELKENKGVYTQGKNQAIWSLVLSVLFIIAVGVGFYRGSTSSLLAANRHLQPKEGRLQFTNFNFEYKIPNKSWVVVDGKKFNTNATFVLVRSNPSGMFMVIAEKPGVESGLTEDALVENVKAIVESSSTSFRLLGEKPVKLKQMSGKGMELEFETQNSRYFSSQSLFYHHGYVYQLLVRGLVADSDRLRKEAVAVFNGFELLDPDRVAHVANPSILPHYESAFGYQVDLKGSGWRKWSDKSKSDTSAEFATLYKQTGAMMVVPLFLQGSDLPWDAIVAGALERLTILATDENLVPIPRPTGAMTNAYFSYERVVDNIPFVYRILITRNKHCAYMVGAWHQKDKAMPENLLDDAINQVTFTPDSQFTPPAASAFTHHQKEVQSLFFNDVGLSFYKEDAFEKAAACFQIARGFDKKNKTFVSNILRAYDESKQFDKAVQVLTEAKDLFSDNEFRTKQAYFLNQTGHPEDAVKNYAIAFDGKYQNDDAFVEYLDLLLQRDEFDAGLQQLEKYLPLKDSPRFRIWQAAFLREKKEFDKAISLLQEQRAKFPANKDVAYGLWESYHAAERDTESLAICEELLKKGVDSVRVYYLKGRSELGLKHYREAKSSFETALKKNPSDTDVKEFLDHVSGILGEGDNTAIKTVIAPVPIPDVVMQDPPVATSADAKEYGAHYIKTIDALSFEKGKEQKHTQCARVKVHNANGVTKFSSLEFSFDPLAEEIFVNELLVKNAEGKVVWTGKISDYYVVDEGGETANQNKTLHVPIAGLQPGYTIDWTVTRREFGKAKAFSYFYRTFSKYYPVTCATIFLRGDVDMVKCVTSPNLTAQKVDGGVFWQMRQPPVVHFEPLQAAFQTYMPMIWLVDANAAWTNEAKEYLKSIEDKLVLDSTTRSMAEKQIAGSSNTADKVSRLAQFVQTNLTYKAIEFGRRARVPNAADKVIENRYGDCKDHALVLHQLLKGIGITSHLALVNSSVAIKREVPSIDQFDHMIVYVPSLGSGTFFDCTAKNLDAAEAALADTAGADALVLDANDPRLIAIPHYPTNATKIVVERELKIENQTDAVVRETVLLYGYNASYYRALLKTTEPGDWKNVMQKHLSQDNYPVEIEEVQIEHVDDLGKPLRVKTRSRVKNSFHDIDGSLAGKVPVCWELQYISSEPVDKRETPFEIKYDQWIQSLTAIIPPKGFKLSGNAALNQNSNSEYARCLSASETAASGSMQWRYEFRQAIGSHPASAYAAQQASITKAMQLLQPNIVFQKVRE